MHATHQHANFTPPLSKCLATGLVWASEVPPGLLVMSKKKPYLAPQVSIRGRVNWWVHVVTVVGGRKQVMVNVHLRVHDGTQTHDPGMKRTKTQP